MTAKQIAEKTGVHYQTVLREIRKTVKKEDPKFLEGVPGTGTGKRKAHDFDEVKTAYIIAKIDALKNLKNTWNSPKGSTQNQRREWTKTWMDRVIESSDLDKGQSVATILGLIPFSATIENLEKGLGSTRTGDVALRLIAEIDPDFLKTDSFALWLQESKFTAPIIS